MKGWFAVAVVLAVPALGAAQVQSRPTDPPLVTAASEAWFVRGEPLQFAGDLYYRAGAAIFFNGNTMVRVGHYNGVPFYADATVEPYSIVLVPVSRGLMQPYERLRRSDLAGTSGSRPPSFPVHPTPDRIGQTMAAAPPAATLLPGGAIGAFTPETRSPAAPVQSPDVVGTAGAVTPPPPLVTLMRPEGNDGIWIRYQNRRYVSAGAPVLITEDEFARIGEYAGFPVFHRRGAPDDVIYLPAGPGLAAPYRAKS